MSLPYATIDIRIHPMNRAAGAYPVEAELDDGGRFAGELRLDYGQLLQHESAPLDYGFDLFDALFAGRIRRAYDKATGRAENETDGRLRVRLRIDAAASELHALHWERLYHCYRCQDVPLAASARTPFSRFTSLDAAEPPAVDERPIRLLFAVANPSNLAEYPGLAPVVLSEEIEAMRCAVGDLPGPSRYRVTLMPGRTELPCDLAASLQAERYEIRPGPTTLEALAGNRPGYHILHFLGHGAFQRTSPRGPGQALLYLEDDDGRARPLPDELIIQKLVANWARPVLVFLGACTSGRRDPVPAQPGLASRLVAAGIPAVIAMQAPLPFATASQLTREFYRRLLEHGILDRAMNEARNLVILPDDPAWSIPALFMRPRDGQIFDTHPPAVRAAPTPLRPLAEGPGIATAGRSDASVAQA